jgi:hypothetical protein
MASLAYNKAAARASSQTGDSYDFKLGGENENFILYDTRE